MSGFKQPFSLLVKPASGDCNLACDYCFYLKKRGLYPESERHRMSDEVLETMIEKYMATDQPVFSFGWQGGEPTLMGTRFFEKATSLEKKYGPPGAVVSNSVQTNATMINDEMARHFARYRYLVGCSLDGPPELHDRFRLTRSGNPTHNKVISGIRLLERHRVETNILTLVSKVNVGHAGRVYRYLRDQGFYYHQYIPCVELDERGEPREFTIFDAEWGRFLSALFDTWYENDPTRVSIRFFDSIIHRLVMGSVNVCQMGNDCRQYLVVEHNGDIYPCDFFVDKKWKLGNVMTDSWEEIWNRDAYIRFGTGKAKWNEACASCAHLDLCGGDCLKHRMYNGRSSENLSWLCAGQKFFFDHTRARFESLASRVRRRRISERRTTKVGRNDPCPCGSQRKFKKCCGK